MNLFIMNLSSLGRPLMNKKGNEISFP